MKFKFFRQTEKVINSISVDVHRIFDLNTSLKFSQNQKSLDLKNFGCKIFQIDRVWGNQLGPLLRMKLN